MLSTILYLLLVFKHRHRACKDCPYVTAIDQCNHTRPYTLTWPPVLVRVKLAGHLTHILLNTSTGTEVGVGADKVVDGLPISPTTPTSLGARAPLAPPEGRTHTLALYMCSGWLVGKERHVQIWIIPQVSKTEGKDQQFFQWILYVAIISNTVKIMCLGKHNWGSKFMFDKGSP